MEIIRRTRILATENGVRDTMWMLHSSRKTLDIAKFVKNQHSWVMDGAVHVVLGSQGKSLNVIEVRLTRRTFVNVLFRVHQERISDQKSMLKSSSS
jgi:hypothetical protein